MRHVLLRWWLSRTICFQLLDDFRAWIVIVTEGRDGQPLCFGIEREIQSADVTAVRPSRQRPFLKLGMSNLRLARGTAPRHKVPPPMLSVRNPPLREAQERAQREYHFKLLQASREVGG